MSCRDRIFLRLSTLSISGDMRGTETMVWRLVNIFIACILLGITLLWIRSFVVAERFAMQKANTRVMIVTSEGSFIYIRNQVDFSDPEVQRRWFDRAGGDAVEWA